MLCKKCHKQHSLRNAETKTYSCQTTVVGTKWDTSPDYQDRTFNFSECPSDDKMDEAAKSLVQHLLACGFADPVVIQGNPYYGKWLSGVLEVVAGEGDEGLIPIVWRNCPVMINRDENPLECDCDDCDV